MGSDKRKDVRQPLRYPALIDVGDGSPPRACLISNISASGAKVTVENPDDLPDRLNLVLAAEQGAKRRCEVVWRAQQSLGLEFVKTPPPKEAPKLSKAIKPAIRHD